MTNEEFLQKTIEIRNKIADILREIKFMDGYIYHQELFVKVHDWVRKALDDMDYDIKRIKDRTNEGKIFSNETIVKYMEKYEHYLLLDTNMLNELKEIKFTAPR